MGVAEGWSALSDFACQDLESFVFIDVSVCAVAR
jgi:hypothetical protein